MAGRVLLSEKAREYRIKVKDALAHQLGEAPMLSGRLAVRVELNMPDLAGRDIPNYDKGLLDALTLAGLWVDDEQIDFFQIRRGRMIRGGRCVLDVVELAPPVVQFALAGVEAP